MMILFGEPMPSVDTWFTANARAITKTRSAGIRNNISNTIKNVLLEFIIWETELIRYTSFTMKA